MKKKKLGEIESVEEEEHNKVGPVMGSRGQGGRGLGWEVCCLVRMEWEETMSIPPSYEQGEGDQRTEMASLEEDSLMGNRLEIVVDHFPPLEVERMSETWNGGRQQDGSVEEEDDCGVERKK